MAQEFLMVAVVPLRDTSGAIVGALLIGREIDDEFMAEINALRHNVQLALIHEDQILAQHVSPSIDEQMTTKQDLPPAEELPDIALLLDETALEQALNGQTVIGEELVLLAEDEP